MSSFNETAIKAFVTRKYVCNECGAAMEFEDEWEDVLICPECGHEIESERYGLEDDEEYETLFPTKEEVLGTEEECEKYDAGEKYVEVCDEMSRHLE
ncbi:MAG: hypothetical protein EUB_01552 [Eubacterium sp.]|uniref:DNA-directed RNA polymerase I n=1 Tax=Eubacterium sp. TaxID=142586 RepID=UPI003060F5BC